MQRVHLSMALPPSAWTCTDCDFASLYPSSFPPWRRGLGLAVFVAGLLAVAPLPLFVWRSRDVFALRVRQPVTVAFVCLAALVSLVIPFR